MKNFIKICCLLFVLILSAVSLHGCRSKDSSDSEPAGRVVVKITVAYENGPLSAYREYTTAEKMQYVLNYLRYIDPYGTPTEDPETAAGSEYRIALVYPDGQEKIYRQKSDRFMQVNGGSWKAINPQRAQNLGLIMGNMESDAN